jgi:flavin-dependent dehydrogenase
LLAVPPCRPAEKRDREPNHCPRNPAKRPNDQLVCSSNFRQIPDNQEVYLDADGFSSIVVEILERVEKPDPEALEYHFKDLITDDEDDAAEKTRVWGRGSAVGGKLP